VIAVSQQAEQQIEYLRLDSDGIAAAAQLPPFKLKRVVRKAKFHRTANAPAPAAAGVKQ